MDPISVVSEELSEIEGQINDLFRALSSVLVILDGFRRKLNNGGDSIEEGKPQKKTILGEDGKEVVVADVGAEKKCQEDQLVLSILQQSLDRSLQEGYSYCETSNELWDTLQKVYGNNSNISRVFDVKRAINTLSQEDNDFDKHFGKFISLWAELEILRPATIDPDVLNQRREQDKVFALLLTLHPSYGSVGLFGGGKKDLVLANQADGAANKSSYKTEDKKKFRTGYNDVKANFSGDIGEPSIQGSMRQTNKACENKGGASSSGSALTNTQDETIRRSDIEALIKLLKDNSVPSIFILTMMPFVRAYDTVVAGHKKYLNGLSSISLIVVSYLMIVILVENVIGMPRSMKICSFTLLVLLLGFPLLVAVRAHNEEKERLCLWIFQLPRDLPCLTLLSPTLRMVRVSFGSDVVANDMARHDKQYQTVTSLLYSSAQFFGVSLEHMELPRPVWGRLHLRRIFT
ncbi:hypothetical protein Bca4012_029463 [Brassica carinata]